MDTVIEQRTYCLYTSVGQESKVAHQLRRMGYEALAPYVVRGVYSNGTRRTRKKRLIPGYVFFDSFEEPDWSRIISLPSVLRILRYADGNRALREKDLEFVAWLKSCQGIVDVSHAIAEGSWIRILDGPLKHYEGKIVTMDRNRRTAAVEVGTEGHFKQIWCSFELLEEQNIQKEW